MRLLFLTILASCVIAKWNRPIELIQSRYPIYVKSLFTDQSTGFHHILWSEAWGHVMHYWVINESNQVIRKKRLESFDLNMHFAGKITGPGDGKTFYVVLNGLRKKGYTFLYDLWFTETKDGGETWKKLTPVPREKMNDENQRYGDCLVVTHDDGRIYLVYHNDDRKTKTELYMVTRNPGETDFEKERKIYANPDYDEFQLSITGDSTKKNGKSIVHFFWADKKRQKGPILTMKTEDGGKTFSQPKIISGKDNFAGYLSLISTSNPEISTTIVGTYPVQNVNSLKMFYSHNHGSTFDVVDATYDNQAKVTWDFRTTGLTIAGKAEKPQLFLLAQTNNVRIEYGVWDLKTMKVKRELAPFTDKVAASGVYLSSHVTGDKILVTAIVPNKKEDNKYYLEIAQDVRELQSLI